MQHAWWHNAMYRQRTARQSARMGPRMDTRETLLRLMHDFGFSEAQVAVAVGKTQTTVYRWRTGRSAGPSIHDLQLVAQAAGANPDDYGITTAGGTGTPPAWARELVAEILECDSDMRKRADDLAARLDRIEQVLERALGPTA